MLENLYGKIEHETRLVERALVAASGRDTAHPDDRSGWSPINPTYGHCDIYTEYVRNIWGKNEDGHWNSEAKILVWWIYSDKESFLCGPRKNKLTVHYSFKHPEYGIIDLAHNQFPDKTFLYPRPAPLSHTIPVQRPWDKTSEMKKRKELFEKTFIESLLRMPLTESVTPEFSTYLRKIA